MSSIHNKEKKKRLLMRRQNGRCWLCEKPMAFKDATFDHVIPRKKLGGSAMGNLKLAHMECNAARGSAMESVFVESNGVVALRWNIRSIGYI